MPLAHKDIPTDVTTPSFSDLGVAESVERAPRAKACHATMPLPGRSVTQGRMKDRVTAHASFERRNAFSPCVGELIASVTNTDV